jgi:hypothetical protein
MEGRWPLHREARNGPRGLTQRNRAVRVLADRRRFAKVEQHTRTSCSSIPVAAGPNRPVRTAVKTSG